MKTKQLSREETVKLIELTQNRIELNNRINKFVREYMKKNNIVGFNGWHDAPKSGMIEALKKILDNEAWMPEDMKHVYLKDTSAIFGQSYSVAVNTYVRTDLKDLKAHLKEIDSAIEKTEENHEEFGFSVIRDVEDTRMNLFFDSIPDEEIRRILKSNGFKWAPSIQAWTRQLTPNAEYSLKRVLQQLAQHFGTEI